ncbi:MAG: DUF72 domain-containing protein [Fidelibacterota bacterium]
MTGKNTYRIGTSGWNYPHWKKRFYPEAIKKKDWFGYYCRHFDTVEVNNTFYRWPGKDILKKWHDSAPSSFRFTLKVPRMITHMKKLKDCGEYVRQFYDLAASLKQKMGCFLFQLPPNYTFTEHNFSKLRTFIAHLDGRKNNVIEFRDKAWWNRDVYALLEESNIAFCTVSGLDMPGEQVVTSDLAYYRFHGRHYSTQYSELEIKEFAARMKDLQGEKIFAYFNNDNNAYAVKNAQQLMKELNHA